MPASNTRTAGGRGWICPSSRPTRRAITSFSLQVLTKSRYFWRLSKKRKLLSGSAFCTAAAAVQKADPESNFRFFDNRQKYLLFVNTCSEKDVIARRVGLELGQIHPRPPAVRVFDAGMGDGTVLARVMREMHRRFATVPFYIVGK